MPAGRIGDVAPAFRLRSGPGPDVALDDYRGRSHVIEEDGTNGYQERGKGGFGRRGATSHSSAGAKRAIPAATGSASP
jgi:hypothetical protein